MQCKHHIPSLNAEHGSQDLDRKELDESIKRVKDSVDKLETKTSANLTREVESLTSNIAQTAETAHQELQNSVNKISQSIDELSEQIDTEVTVANSRLDNAVTTLYSAVDATENRVNNRVDNIIANSSSTEGNSELIDIRSGIDGMTYSSAGTAVREQMKNIRHQTEILADTLFHVYNLIDIGYFMQNVDFQHTEGTPYPNGKIISGTKNIVVIPVDPTKEYFFTQLSDVYYDIVLYNKSMSFISTLYSYHNNSGSWSNEWSIPENCYYVAAVIGDSFKDTAFFGLQSDYSKWTAGYRFDTNQTENNSQQNNALKTDFRTDCLKLTKNIRVPDNTSIINLLDIAYVLNGKSFNTSTGEIIEGSSTVKIIPVTPGASYYYTQLSNVYYNILLYDNDMNFISTMYSYHNNTGSWNNEWSVPDNCHFVAAIIGSDYQDSAYFGSHTDYTLWTEGYKKIIANDTYLIKQPNKNHKLIINADSLGDAEQLQLDVSASPFR